LLKERLAPCQERTTLFIRECCTLPDVGKKIDKVKALPMLDIPIDTERFFATYFEQQPLLMAQACSGSVFNWNDFDNLLEVMEPDEESLQLFLNGPIPAPHYLDHTFEFGRQRQRINKYRFYEHLEHGATVVVNRAETYSPIVKNLCHAIGSFAQQPASGNIYINFSTGTHANTPNDHAKKGGTTFGKHWDTHDVFVIQLIGKKRWQLYPPTLPLPLSHQTSKQLQHELPQTPQTPSAEYVLNAGDILYIPRGWWHEVSPIDVDTLHLSVGTYAPTLTDYLMWALKKTLPEISNARLSCINQKNVVSTLQAILTAAAPDILSQHRFADFIHQTCATERLNGEFHTALALGKADKNALTDCHFLLTSVYPFIQQEQDIRVNAGRLRLTSVSRSIMQILSQQHALSWAQLCNHLPDLPVAAIESSVLDLARHDVITIRQGH
jgi:ribosomal protein L16 Arg81 hydroxylase